MPKPSSSGEDAVSRTEETSNRPEQWPTPRSFDDKLPPVDAFDETSLPDCLRRWVVDIADRMQVAIDLPAAVLIVMLGAAISLRAMIQPKARDREWTEVPNLYGGIIAPPGFMKSPVIRAVAGPLESIEQKWHKEYAAAMREYEELSDEEQKQSEKPKFRRLTINDTTFEKLQELLSENPRGLLVIRDELVGLLASFDRNGHEGERQFYLTAWNGQSSYSMDRIGRGTILLPKCCLSVIGAIQPKRLRDYLASQGEDGPVNDGMIQRFQLLVWPDFSGWTYVDRGADQAALDEVNQVFEKIVNLEPAHSLRLRFTEDAQELFVTWYRNLETRIRGNELDLALTAHLSKFRGLMPSLALIFEIAERAVKGFAGSAGLRARAPLVPTGPLVAGRVSAENTKRAIRFCTYLESHARRIYSIYDAEKEAAKRLSIKIGQRRVGVDGCFTVRDVYQKGWSGLGDPEKVRRAINILVEMGWVRPDDNTTTGKSGGRPSERYEINPRIREQPSGKSE